MLPLVLAIILVIVAKISLFTIIIIQDNSMSPLFEKGDKVLCFKKKAKKRNKIVLFVDDYVGMEYAVKRQIATPGDTLAIKSGVIIVNGRKVSSIESVTQKYAFLTDSIVSISKYLVDNEITTDFRRIHLGYFECKLSEKDVNELKSLSTISNFKRKNLESKIRLSEDNFGGSFYWNHDNLGSLIIPKQGMRIKLGKRSFYLYKNIISEECGIEPLLKGNDVFIGDVKTEIYTFKQDYLFLVNDNRSNNTDSRTFGFVAENKLIGTYLFKLPW